MRKDKTITLCKSKYIDIDVECSLSDFDDDDVIAYTRTLVDMATLTERVETLAQAAYVAYCQRDEAQELLLGRELVGELLGRILGGIPNAALTNNAQGQSCKPPSLN